MEDSDKIISLQHAQIYQSGSTLVLSDVNFTIAKGEFVYLIGRTGSGKSSLLKTLYADLWLERGLGYIAGFELHTIKKSTVPYLRRKIGVVFQDFQLFMDRNVHDNLYFILEATGWENQAKMNARISIVLAQVGLENTLDKFPHQLSGGEQQRVVIARALLNEPLIILADEPTGNLDPEVSEQIMRTFEAINKAGTAILMATHDYLLIEKYKRRTLKCIDGLVKEI
ncbi:MAG: ATP-binding cassette domain-containing protein [Bacteroidota bacterium]